jgi:CubicO group peptidase (beta-lactamase class C family)
VQNCEVPVSAVDSSIDDAIDDARRVLLDAVAGRVFPAAVVDVGSSGGRLWHQAFGTLTFGPRARPTDETTPFDLASLTKVIATTTVIMDLVGSGPIRLDDLLVDWLPEWRGADRESVTVHDLLVHASGLPARLLEPPPSTVRELAHDICVMPLEYAPRTRSIYSDLGFILLGLLATERVGRVLAAQFAAIKDRLSEQEAALAREPLTFELSGAERARAAPTVPMDQDVRRGRTLLGEVHDNYAAVLGPVAGHAGLFGTARGVASFARLVLRAARGDETVPAPMSPARVATFLTKTSVAGSSRALGWDTMKPTSSCGTRMSPAAVGHVGFTGTSLWIDPARDRYFVLLTNRSYQGGTVDQMQAVRRAFHDALGDL